MRRLIQHMHGNLFSGPEMMKQESKWLGEVLEPNDRYHDPKGAVLPAKLGPVPKCRISDGARPASRLLSATPIPAKMPLNTTPSPKRAPTSPFVALLNKPLPTTLDGLRKERFYVDHNILCLQQRGKALQQAIKQMEGKPALSVQAQLDEAKRLLKERDQEIRRLQAAPSTVTSGCGLY